MIHFIKTVLIFLSMISFFTLKSLAITVSGDGSFDVTYIVPKGTVGDTGPLPFDLIGHSTWTISNFSSNGFDLSINMKNDTVVAPTYDPKDARITAFGFNINPDMTISNFQNGNAFIDYAVNTTFPSFSTIDMCIFGGNNCAGGSNGGLYAGSSDLVSFRLDFPESTVNVSSFILNTFGAKWQTAWGSFEPEGCVGNNCTPPTPSPEPESVFLIISGLGLMFYLKRRRA